MNRTSAAISCFEKNHKHQEEEAIVGKLNMAILSSVSKMLQFLIILCISASKSNDKLWKMRNLGTFSWANL